MARVCLEEVHWSVLAAAVYHLNFDALSVVPIQRPVVSTEQLSSGKYLTAPLKLAVVNVSWLYT